MGIKNFFFEIEEKPEKQEQAKASSTYQPPVYQNSSVQPIPQSTPVVAPIGGIDPKFREHVNKLFEDSNLPGPDFFEFTKSKENMLKITPGLSDQQYFLMTYGALAPSGLTKEKLLETSKHYIDILDKELSDLNANFSEKRKELVLDKLDQIEVERQKLIDLQKQIETVNQNIIRLTQESTTNEQTLTNNLQQYTIANAEMKNLILADVEKIKQFIQ